MIEPLTQMLENPEVISSSVYYIDFLANYEIITLIKTAADNFIIKIKLIIDEVYL